MENKRKSTDTEIIANLKEVLKSLEKDLKDKVSQCLALEKDLKDKDSQCLALEKDLKDKVSQCLALEKERIVDENNLKIVPSAYYKHKNGSSYRFQNKNAKFTLSYFGECTAKECLEDAKKMTLLIKMGYGGLQKK